MSSALAHHYFGSKDRIFLAAMRSILSIYGAEVRGAMAMAQTPHERVRAVVMGSFAAGSFRHEAIAAWLNFYVLAQSSADARRLLHIYQRRLRSNLVHGLRPLVGDRAGSVAEGLGALIDGVYIRAALVAGDPDREAACNLVLAHLEKELEVHQ
tara:strand:- start:24 stop:485 length:462 start_codon:yes stop_codon:yes gene_type:complete